MEFVFVPEGLLLGLSIFRTKASLQASVSNIRNFSYVGNFSNVSNVRGCSELTSPYLDLFGPF